LSLFPEKALITNRRPCTAQHPRTRTLLPDNGNDQTVFVQAAGIAAKCSRRSQLRL